MSKYYEGPAYCSECGKDLLAIVQDRIYGPRTLCNDCTEVLNNNEAKLSDE